MRFLIHLLIRLVLRLLFGLSGTNAKPSFPSMIVANHNSHLDTFALFTLFPLSQIRRVHAVAAADYFKKGIMGAFARYAFNAILISRVKDATPGEKLKPVYEALESNHAVIIFPEGSRGMPGILQRFKSGIGELAVKFPDVPVIPVCLSGADKSLAKGHRFPVPFTMTMSRLPEIYGRTFLADDPRTARKRITRTLEMTITSAMIFS